MTKVTLELDPKMLEILISSVDDEIDDRFDRCNINTQHNLRQEHKMEIMKGIINFTEKLIKLKHELISHRKVFTLDDVPF